jgi:hypothetical protein
LDVITLLEELPVLDFCYLNKSSQCFTKLKTLKHTALQSVHLVHTVTLDVLKIQNFLQPPHFQTAASSDDLLDQIALRFGRNA